MWRNPPALAHLCKEELCHAQGVAAKSQGVAAKSQGHPWATMATQLYFLID